MCSERKVYYNNNIIPQGKIMHKREHLFYIPTFLYNIYIYIKKNNHISPNVPKKKYKVDRSDIDKAYAATS